MAARSACHTPITQLNLSSGSRCSERGEVAPPRIGRPGRDGDAVSAVPGSSSERPQPLYWRSDTRSNGLARRIPIHRYHEVAAGPWRLDVNAVAVACPAGLSPLLGAAAMTMGASFRSTLVANKRYVALSRYADSDAEEQLAKENVVLGDAYTAFDIEWLAGC